MRIDRLDLVRYGHFTDHTVELALPGEGAHHAGMESLPDLHLVYGPNEAGKSTMLAAIVDVLFGMPRISRYGFMHDYATLHIGARLQHSDRAMDIHRYKNHLADADGRRLAENHIDTQGLDRERYLHRFSFDDETLQRGGEQILESQGDLGEALFSASSGLADLHERLERALAPSRLFYDRGKRTDLALITLTQRLRAIDDELKVIDINAAQFRRQEKQALEAKALYEALDESLRATDLRIEHLRRQRTGLDCRRRWQAAQADRERLSNARDLPAGWRQELSELAPLDAELRGSRDVLQQQWQAVETRRRELPAQPDVLRHAATIDRLCAEITHQQSRQSEGSSEQLALQDTADNVARLVTVLPTPPVKDPAALTLPVSLFDALDRHLVDGATLQVRHQTAIDDLAATRSARAALPPQEATGTAANRLLENLSAVLDERAGSERLADAQRLAFEHAVELDQAGLALAPYQGDPRRLAAEPIPGPSWLDSVESEVQKAEAEHSLARQRHRDLCDEMHEWQLKSAPLDHDAEDDGKAAAESRQRRDRAWDAHLAQLEAPAGDGAALRASARTFASALVDDDRLAAQRLSKADERARHRQALAERGHREGALVRSELAVADSGERLTSLQDSLAKQIESCGLPGDTGIAAVRHWLVRRERYLKLLAEQQRRECEVARLEEQCASQAHRLKGVLRASFEEEDPPALDEAGLDELMALARRRLEVIRSRAEKQSRDQERHDALQQRERELQRQVDTLAVALDDWQSDIERLLEDTWLKGTGVDRLRDRLPDLRRLNQALWQQAETLTRVRARERDVTRFIGEIAALDAQNAAPGTLDEALVRLRAMQSTLTSAREQWQERQRLQRSAADTRDRLDELEARHQPVRQRLRHMLDTAGCGTLEALSTALERSVERAEIERRIAALEIELTTTLEVDDPAQALAQLADVQAETLSAELAALEERRTVDRTLAVERHHAWRALADPLEALAGDASAARLREERATVLLEIEQGSRDCLRARVGHEVVVEALRRFRDQHRSTMMQHARDAFIALTRDHFIDLHSQPDPKANHADQLVAIRADGTSLLAKSMSTGTRLQLYLALRVAAYHDYRQHRRPLPFVADDIMETFDDERAAAAFELLADMARHGQVIYLTHHRHLVDIARDVVGPSLSVHELPSRLAAQPQV